ncbi:GNAT family N-acetyltransferase [Tumebacillus lipolyticus]|uniref:GNAT family N-acetyltransferase n=1 Tax=Tumebacillus lipolyticus TaxID=1280370 RepID=A0ABW5A149_9BACL
MSEYTIQFGRLEDAELIHALTQDAFSTYKSLPMPSSALQETAAEVRAALDQQNMQVVLCAASQGERVGCVRFSVQQDGLYFSRVAVAREWQGRGIAKRMLAWLERFAEEQGQRRLWCKVRAELPRNIELYRGQGYRIFYEELVERAGERIETLHMEKVIEPSEQ